MMNKPAQPVLAWLTKRSPSAARRLSGTGAALGTRRLAQSDGRHYQGRSSKPRKPILLASALSATVTGLGLGAWGLTTQSEKDGVQNTCSQYASRAEMEKAVEEIRQAIGDDGVSIEDEILHSHGYSDWSTINIDQLPVAVAFPKSTEEVSIIAKICHKRRVPMIPYSGGSSVEGHFSAPFGGVSVDFLNMNRILDLHCDDLDVVVQPCVSWMEMNEQIKHTGLFFPIDPGPSAQIGGMIGTNCSGTNAVRYGTMKDWTINITVVLSDGRILKTRQRPRKSSAGYNLTSLFVGSEGTLGFVTEATLKLAPIPEQTGVAVVTFPTVKAAATMAIEVIRQGVPIGAVEILDEVLMSVINRVGGTSRKWDEVPTLFFRFSGSDALVQDGISRARRIAQSHEARDFLYESDPHKQKVLWSARKEALWSMMALRETEGQVWSTDVAVPLSRVAELIDISKKDLVELGLFGSILGHIGDGNFHETILFEPKQRKLVEDCVHKMVHRALEMEGTCTGEHGVGLGKKDFLQQELGQTPIEVMRAIKSSLDPHWLMNPGKIFDRCSEILQVSDFCDVVTMDANMLLRNVSTNNVGVTQHDGVLLIGEGAKYTTSFAFFEALVEAGVKNCFVNLGSDHPSILEAMVRGQKEMPDTFPRIMTCPNEMVALSMADGYARLSGEAQCVIVHVDVGTSALAAAIHNAAMGRAPVLIFAGLSPFTIEGELLGSRTEFIHWIQDVPDQKQIVSQYCRYVGEIKTGKNVKQMVRRALQFATSQPQGPAYLMGAREVMEETIEPYSIDSSFWKPVAPAALPQEAVQEIAEALVTASEPLVIVGYTGRNHAAVEPLVSLANAVKGLRVLDTGCSDMCFPADHPGWLGMRYGVDASVETADVVLILDCDVPWINKLCKPKKSARIFHLDVDPLKQSMLVFYIDAEQRYRVDAEVSLRQLVEHIRGPLASKLTNPELDRRAETLASTHAERIRALDERAKLIPDSGKLTVDYVCSTLRKRLPSDTIFAVEAITNAMAVADQIRATILGQWIHCGGGGLGWSGGGALGIKLAADAADALMPGKRKRYVVQIVGDGSFMFSVPSSVYWVSSRYGIPVLTVVLNNLGWNAPRRSMLLVHPDGPASRVTNEELNISFAPSPDYAGIARAASNGLIFGARVSDASQLQEALEGAVESLDRGVSAVLDVSI